MAEERTQVKEPDIEKRFPEEVRSVALARSGSITEVQVNAEAAMLKARWGTATSMDAQTMRAMVMMAREMGMNPIFHLNVIGDSLYDTADFWRSMLTASPLIEDVQVKSIRPGSEDWDEWIGIDPPDKVAAAALCSISVVGRKSPVVEANYVMKDDAILMAQGQKTVEFGPGDEGKAKANAFEADGGRIWLGKAEGGKPRSWMGKGQSLADDWQAIAKKKARTTAMRRAAMMALPREAAHLMSNMDKLQRLLDSRKSDPTSAVVSTPPDPYTPEASTHTDEPVIEGSSRITEEHRRMLHAIAGEKGISHEELKTYVSEVTGETNDVASTTTLTYEQMAQVVALLEALPNVRDDEDDERE